MGGDQRQQPFWDSSDIQKQNLPYTGDMPQQVTASDDYTQQHFKKRDAWNQKQQDALFDALSRLGMVKESMPQGMVPNPPYRLPEQPQIGF